MPFSGILEGFRCALCGRGDISESSRKCQQDSEDFQQILRCYRGVSGVSDGLRCVTAGPRGLQEVSEYFQRVEPVCP